MALKFKITKKEYDKLADDMKDQYEVNGDGKSYTLEIDGLPDDEGGAPELKRANERLKEERDTLKDDLKEATDKITELSDGQSTGDRDVVKVTTRYKQKVADAETAGKTRVTAIQKKFGDAQIKSLAEGMATKISTSPALFADQVAKRLTVEWDDEDNMTVKVLKDGKASDMKIDDLEKELSADKAFASVIKGSKASGSGTPASAVPLKGVSDVAEKPVDLSKAGKSDLTAAIKSKIEAKAQGAAT